MVKPGDTVALPAMGEPTGNEAGSEKRDCERNAAKRWLSKRAAEHARLRPTLLGDDLFSCQPMCEAALACGLSFIFTRKPQSHPWLAETVANSVPGEKTKREWNGRRHVLWRWQWLNGVELRDSPDALKVDYAHLEITNEKTGKTVFRNGWATDKAVTADNVALIASCGRARWKIENERNSALKNHGYNLRHNFGRGQDRASEMCCLLNLLAFLWHGILMLLDEGCQRARAS